MEDIRGLESKYDSIRRTGQELIKQRPDQHLKTRVVKVQTHWTDTVLKAKEQNQLLTQGLHHTKMVQSYKITL